MLNWKLWLRWTWRDLRARWVQVLAIAIIIALGAGVFAGLGGQETWRKASYDASYERLNMHDLKVELATGSFVDGAALVEELSQVEGVADVEVRLVTPTLVDASHGDETIVVKGRMIGVDVSGGGPVVDGITADGGAGRALTAADAGEQVAALEYKFARHHDIKPGMTIRTSGDMTLEVVGNVHSPEYFMVMPETAVYFAEASFAVAFLPLETAQQITGREGLVNNAVLTVSDQADLAAVRAAIESRMQKAFPETSIDITERADDPVYSTLYSDAEGDQVMWNIIAVVFLIGAAMGAFNLAGRMVESQRREIGIGMALGLPRRWIAFRPMLVGLQIALLGTVLGLVFGWVLNQVFVDQVKELMPLPYYDISFYLPGYARAILVGILLPFIATLIPVWRAVRVAPIDAISAGYLVAKGGGLARLVKNLSLPGKSFVRMPINNILRSPWRALMTALGVAIAVALLTFIVGALDTYVATIDQADEAFRHEGANRILVRLDFFYPLENGEINGLRTLTLADGTPLASDFETALELGGTLRHNGVAIDTALDVHDMDRAIWTPELVTGELQSDAPGLIISQKAADDLGVTVGDTITLEHPRRTGPQSFQQVPTELPVIGIHNNPIRSLSYMDMQGASIMGLEGVTNLVVLTPPDDVSKDVVKKALLTQPGVASVEPISEFSEAARNLLELAVGLLGIVSAVVLLMAFLIAFNSTSISVDERVREIATMFAFGLRIRTVTRMQMLENVLIGLAGTVIGVLVGWGILRAVFNMEMVELEDIRFTISLSTPTLLLAVLVGVVVVGLTPLLSVRKMRKMDIPSTLRVME